MDWLIVEQLDDDGACLLGLRAADGASWIVYRHKKEAPLRSALYPDGGRVAVDSISSTRVKGKIRTRVGLVNLEKQGMGWMRLSLDPKWRIGGARFDAGGRRLAIEGYYGDARQPAIYVFEVNPSGNSLREEMIAGVGGPNGLACRHPVFLPGGEQLVYFEQIAVEGLWGLRRLDLSAPGASAEMLEWKAPSVGVVNLTDEGEPVPHLGVVSDGERLFFVGRSRGGKRQRLRWVSLEGGAVHDLYKNHLKVESICIDPKGERLAWAADGRIWIAPIDGEPRCLVEAEAGRTHAGLRFSPDAATLFFASNDADGGSVHKVDEAGEVTQIAEIEDVTLLDLHVIHGNEAVAAHFSAELDKEDKEEEGSTPPPPPPRPKYPRRRVSTIIDAGVLEEAEQAAKAAAEERDAHPETGMGTAQIQISDAPPPAAASKAPPKRGLSLPPPPKPKFKGLSGLPKPKKGGVPKLGGAKPAGVPKLSLSDKPSPAPRGLSLETAPDIPVEEVEEIEVSEEDFEAAGTVELEREAKALALAAPPPPTVEEALSTLDRLEPSEDFISWIRRLTKEGEPSERLKSLERSRGDRRLSKACEAYLKREVKQAEDKEALVLAISVAAHIKLKSGRGVLRPLLERAKQRMSGGDLPEIEEHYALAALRYAQGAREAFDQAAVFLEYQQMYADLVGVLERDGEAAAAQAMGAQIKSYSEQIEAALSKQSYADASTDQAWLSMPTGNHWLPSGEPQAAPPEEADEAAQKQEEVRRLEALQREEEARRQKEAEEEAARKRAEEEARKRAEAEEAARKRAEEEARKRAEAEEARKRAEAEEARLRAEQAELERIAAEAAARAAEAQAAAEAAAEAARRAASGRAGAGPVAKPAASVPKPAASMPKPAASMPAPPRARMPAARPQRGAIDLGGPVSWGQMKASVGKVTEQAPKDEESWTAIIRLAREGGVQQQGEDVVTAAPEAPKADRPAAPAFDQDKQSWTGVIKLARLDAEIADHEAQEAQPQAASTGSPFNPFMSLPLDAPPRGRAAPPAPEPEPEPARAPSEAPRAAASSAPSFAVDAPDPDSPVHSSAFLDRLSVSQVPDDPWDVHDDPFASRPIPTPSAGQPFFITIAGLAAAAGGLAQLVLGIQLASKGIALLLLAALFLVAGTGLFADRRWGYYLGIPAFLLNGLQFIYFGASAPPDYWIPSALPIIGGAASVAFCGVLLMPQFMARYKQKRSF